MTDKPTQSSPVQWITVDSDYTGQRIDNFLFAQLKGIPKSRIYRMLRKGETRVNKRRIQAKYKLQADDIIRIPPLHHEQREDPTIPSRLLGQRLESRIIYEDDHLLILNKPSGMAVHGGSGLSFGVIEGLRQLRPHGKSLELVHRLDKDTSGCLLIAKKHSTLRHLHQQFRSNEVKKCYTTLLSGSWPRKNVTIEEPLEKYVLKGGERMVRVNAKGKPSLTTFGLIKRLPTATLAEARPMTGRTHQIRVHAAHSGHPVAGDPRYATPEENQRFRRLGLKRLFLHASQVTFEHPANAELLTIKAPLDQELEQFITKLEQLQHEK